jgi:hypothetical protein
MDQTAEGIIYFLEWVAGIAAFVALMQLFPICIRLGQIRDALVKKADKAPERETARQSWGESIAEQQAKL